MDLFSLLLFFVIGILVTCGDKGGFNWPLFWVETSPIWLVLLACAILNPDMVLKFFATIIMGIIEFFIDYWKPILQVIGVLAIIAVIFFLYVYVGNAMVGHEY